MSHQQKYFQEGQKERLGSWESNFRELRTKGINHLEESSAHKRLG